MGEEGENNLVTLPASDEGGAKGLHHLITDWFNRWKGSVIAWTQSLFKGITMLRNSTISSITFWDTGNFKKYMMKLLKNKQTKETFKS